MFSLEGKNALVTGASGGIGREIALHLAGQGARVALSGTRVEALQAVADEIGEQAVIVPANLSAEKGAETLAADAEKALGGVDILVNNAGVTRDNLAMRMKDEEWETVISLNLTSVFKLSRSFLRPMMKKRAGRIINITSIVGVMGNPGQSNYCAAKAGMIGMSKSLAQEVASRGITVNCIAPGFIATPMTDVLPEAQKEQLLSKIPMGQMGAPSDIAAAVCYLSSNEASWMTGQTLHVNGGMVMV